MSCSDMQTQKKTPDTGVPAQPVLSASRPEDTAVSGFPRINEPAPAFEANTTHGPRSLADYKGRWLVLFSHPADFTPVCTTEFIGFAKAAEEFKALECELLGLSIDSIFSHLAWVENIKGKFGVEVPFPIIEDLSMKVAHAYGMIHPGASDTSAVRATFVIDPAGILKAMVYYPMTNGRNVAEIFRLVKALRTSAAQSVATPEGWQPGEKVLVGAPKTTEEIASRMKEGLETTDWYFSMKSPA